VLVTQVDPHLRCYIFKDGLARFATEPYSLKTGDNGNMYKHLTNYAINKKNTNFKKDPSEFKRTVRSVLEVRVKNEL